MDALLFIAAIICLALVVVWYVVNENAHASGEKGFLALAPDKREVKAPSYREKKRARRAAGARLSEEGPDEEGALAFAERSGGFRDKTDEGYKATGPLPRFGERARKTPPEKPES